MAVTGKDIIALLRARPTTVRRHRKQLLQILGAADADVLDVGGANFEKLREENANLRRRLRQWLAHARENERMLAALHRLSLATATPMSTSALETAVRRALSAELEVQHVKLVLLADLTAGSPQRRFVSGLKDVRLAAKAEPGTEEWFGTARGLSAFLYLPVRRGGRVAAVLACASRRKGAFGGGGSDYAQRLSQLIAASLVTGKKAKRGKATR